MLLKSIIISFLLVVFVPWVSTAQKPSPRKPAAKRVVYACPMHPEVTSTRRGRCPKCGMDLRRVKAGPEATPSPTPESPSFSSAKIPNTRIYDQDGKTLNFYDDLIKGKTVAINFVFTTCTASCPPLTATFSKVQQHASERKLNVRLISISVDPVVDTPERLRVFAERYKVEPGWTFVTGDKAEIDSLLQALGAGITNKNDHTPMVMIGNDTADYWTRAYGLSSPATLVNLLATAASRR